MSTPLLDEQILSRLQLCQIDSNVLFKKIDFDSSNQEKS